MTQLRRGAVIKKLKEVKNFEMPISELLEVKGGLVLLGKNEKLPIIEIMSLSEIKQEIQAHLAAYSEANEILKKRLAIVVEDLDGNKIETVAGDKTSEYNAENKKLLDKVCKVKLPTFKIKNLGYDEKRPNTNKYGVPAGAIMGLGRLVERK